MFRKHPAFIPLLLAVTLVAGLVLGNMLNRKSQPEYRPMRTASANKLSTILELVQQAYVDSVDTREIIESTDSRDVGKPGSA